MDGCQALPAFIAWVPRPPNAETMDSLRDWVKIGAMARIAGSNRLTLSRNFKRLYGMTVFEWLREQRLGQAAKLLGESNRPISQIATAVGYSSLQGLANAFKQRFELSPSAYRNVSQNNSQNNSCGNYLLVMHFFLRLAI